ncbi:MAG: hypothetical protein WA040_21365 [Anaerolineae bacterium]
MIKNDIAIISATGSRTEPGEDFPGCGLLGKAVIVVAELLMGRREPVPYVKGQVVRVYPERGIAIVQLESGAIAAYFDDLQEAPHEA